MAGEAREFYRANQIPVHSTIQMKSAAEARAYPRGHLQLAHCPACGFVFNAVFDSSVHEYSSNCEESQAFSPTFNTFAQSLARRWVERYNVRNQTVLEIGCGKGDFLMLLCEAGDNKGIGVDPSCQPERIPPHMRERVSFVQDLYCEKYAHLAADVVLCRHTLEHIAPTRSFMRGIRSAIGGRKETLVLFELPDVVRVLRERAFWDIYYEHCSYFSPGSLARLFRSTGFEVVELERDYGDQYLLIAARPVDHITTASFELEDDLDEMADLVATYANTIAGELERWRRRVRDIAAGGQRVVLWGALSKAVSFLTTLGLNSEIEYVVDINPHRQGKYMPGTGHLIVGPKFLAEYQPDYVIVMNPIYCREIQRDLDQLGVNAKLLAVGVD